MPQCLNVQLRSSRDIVESLSGLSSLYGRIQLCGLLLRREGPDFLLGGDTVRAALERDNKTAEQLRYWAAVRSAGQRLTGP